MELEFYSLPFWTGEWGGYVWGTNDEMLFMFTGSPYNIRAKVVELLNSKERVPNKLYLTIDPNDSGMILNNGEEFILIRGWGNLTGVGGHNLSGVEASKIQDRFRDWILWKLELNKEQINENIK